MFVKAELTRIVTASAISAAETGNLWLVPNRSRARSRLNTFLSALRSFRGAAAAQFPHALDRRSRRPRTSRACGRARVLGCAGRPGRRPVLSSLAAEYPR